MGEETGAPGGLFSALARVATRLLATGKTRLELIGNELEEEKQRAIRALLLAQAMLFFFGCGLILAISFVVVLFWENRIGVLGGLSLLFLALGGVFFSLCARALCRPEKMFAASLAELQEDLRQLKAAAGRDEKSL